MTIEQAQQMLDILQLHQQSIDTLIQVIKYIALLLGIVAGLQTVGLFAKGWNKNA